MVKRACVPSSQRSLGRQGHHVHTTFPQVEAASTFPSYRTTTTQSAAGSPGPYRPRLPVSPEHLREPNQQPAVSARRRRHRVSVRHPAMPRPRRRCPMGVEPVGRHQSSVDEPPRPQAVACPGGRDGQAARSCITVVITAGPARARNGACRTGCATTCPIAVGLRCSGIAADRNWVRYAVLGVERIVR